MTDGLRDRGLRKNRETGRQEMRSGTIIALALCAALALSGCAAERVQRMDAPAAEAQDKINTVESAAEKNAAGEADPGAAAGGQQNNTAGEIPRLTLVPVKTAGGSPVPAGGGGELTVTPSNFEWDSPAEDGSRRCVVACGFAPTDPMVRKDREPVILTGPRTYRLVFGDCQPGSVTAMAWDAAVFDDPEGGHEAEAELLEGQAPGEWTITLMPDMVYDITASWPQSGGGSFGSGGYYIVTAAPARGQK